MLKNNKDSYVSVTNLVLVKVLNLNFMNKTLYIMIIYFQCLIDLYPFAYTKYEFKL